MGKGVLFHSHFTPYIGTSLEHVSLPSARGLSRHQSLIIQNSETFRKVPLNLAGAKYWKMSNKQLLLDHVVLPLILLLTLRYRARSSRCYETLNLRTLWKKPSHPVHAIQEILSAVFQPSRILLRYTLRLFLQTSPTNPAPTTANEEVKTRQQFLLSKCLEQKRLWSEWACLLVIPSESMEHP